MQGPQSSPSQRSKSRAGVCPRHPPAQLRTSPSPLWLPRPSLQSTLSPTMYSAVSFSLFAVLAAAFSGRCFASYSFLRLGRSPFGLLCLLLALLFSLAVGFVLLGSFQHFSRSSMFFSRSSYPCCFPSSSHHWLFGCGSVFWRRLLPALLCGSLLLRGSFYTSNATTQLRGHWFAVGARAPRHCNLLVSCCFCDDWFLFLVFKRFVAAAIRRWSPTPPCDTLGSVHFLSEGFHRGLLSRRGPLVRQRRWAFIDSCVSLCRLTSLTEVFASLVIVTRHFPSRVL